MEPPTLEQAKTIKAFLEASKICEGVKGVNKKEKLTNRSICIKLKSKEILEELSKKSPQELEEIRKQVSRRINRQPSDPRIIHSLVGAIQ